MSISRPKAIAAAMLTASAFTVVSATAASAAPVQHTQHVAVPIAHSVTGMKSVMSIDNWPF